MSFARTSRALSSVAAKPGNPSSSSHLPQKKRAAAKSAKVQAKLAKLSTDTVNATKAYNALSSQMLSAMRRLADLKKEKAPFTDLAAEAAKARVLSKLAKMNGPASQVIPQSSEAERISKMNAILKTKEKYKSMERKHLTHMDIKTVQSSSTPVLKDLDPLAKQRPIAQLAHGLDRVLFNPGVHWVQDPRSGVFNFPSQVQKIPKVSDFAFERLPPFTKSSRDEELWRLAKQHKKTFAGSTSSLSGMLSHIYFMLSENKPVNLSNFTSNFNKARGNFTPGQRMATTVTYNHNDGRYAIDSFGDVAAEKNILTWMGTVLEKYLTTHSTEFPAFMRSEQIEAVPTEEEALRDAFRFSKSRNFVMRSQLDCQDHRLPGTGVFDLKTRASASIRMDLLNFETNSGYLISQLYGTENSFEREYYDLVRSAFLKYSFQARIGNMDGVLVAYHNTEQMFGFQYISLEEMDRCLFNSKKGTDKGDKIFGQCITILEDVSERIIACFPGESVQCTFEASDLFPKLNIWVQPEHWAGEGDGVERPIKQLVVTADHYISEAKVSALAAMQQMSDEKPWRVHYYIGARASNKQESIRQQLEEAQERKFRAFALPDGVKLDQAVDFWKSLNFNGKVDPDEVVPDKEYFASNFAEPDSMIIALRQAAKAGRRETERRKRVEAGLPVFVVGEEYDPAEALRRKQSIQAVSKEIDGADAAALTSAQAKYQNEPHWDPFNGAVPEIKLGFDVEDGGAGDSTPKTTGHIH